MIEPKTPVIKDDVSVNEDNLDEALEESFPASDPLPGIMTGAGAPSGRDTPPLPDNLSITGDPEDEEVADLEDEDEDDIEIEDEDEEIEDDDTEEELADDTALVDDPVGSDDDVAQDPVSGFTPRR